MGISDSLFAILFSKDLHGRELAIPLNHFASTFICSSGYIDGTTSLTWLPDEWLVTRNGKALNTAEKRGSFSHA